MTQADPPESEFDWLDFVVSIEGERLAMRPREPQTCAPLPGLETFHNS